MSRLLLVLILLSLSCSVLLAQGTKGRNGSGITPQTTLAPSTNAPKGSKTNPAASSAQANDRNTTPQVSPNRSANTTYGNATVKKSAQDRAVRPSDSQANRPATYAPPTNATAAKGGTTGTKQKVSPLKSSERGKVNWMTLEQALEKSKTEKRKIFLDLYTDWCGWCKHMDSTTFVDATVAKYLNEHYYPVKFNAEQEQDIVFKDKTYKFKKNGSRGYHELAALWLNNRLSFPTVVFLDESQQLIQPVPGYQDAAKMEAIINYFGSDSHKKTPWESYEKNFSNKR
ncbi:MAG: DUF255 domain-containing protein [Saprospiraceae bacterium]